MKLPLAASLILLASGAASARASELGELRDCFHAIQRFSRGPGVEIGAFERTSTGMRSTIVVTAGRRGREGFYAYSDGPHYAAVPRHEAKAYYVVYDFTLALPDRDPFTCGFRHVHLTGAKMSVECTGLDDGRERKGIAVWPLKPDSEAYWPLKAAVLQRLSTVSMLARKKVEDYKKRLADYEGRNQDPTLFSNLADRMGWRNRPYAPFFDREYKALESCRNTEDPAVREAAQTGLTMLTPLMSVD